MTEIELKVANVCLSDKVHREFEAVNRFMAKLKPYELDMDFEPKTDLEINLKDELLTIFKLAHKLQDEIKNIKEEN